MKLLKLARLLVVIFIGIAIAMLINSAHDISVAIGKKHVANTCDRQGEFRSNGEHYHCMSYVPMGSPK